MRNDQDSGDKTERPTPKRLKDARKQGQVAKSRDLTSTVELFVWLALVLLGAGWIGTRLTALFDAVLVGAWQPFDLAAPALGEAAWHTLLMVAAAVLLPVAVVGLAAELLQVGGLFATERVKPRLENLDPVQGVKRLFSRDAVFELAKSVVKTAVLVTIGWLAVRSVLPELAQLPRSHAPGHLVDAWLAVARPMLIWAVVAFVLLAAIDAVYQRWSFTKRLRMSLRDIRQELKETEGDPHIRQHRRQAAQEAMERGAAAAARGANVLVVNPTHVAIAIDYDRERCPVPTIAAKGEHELAQVMREAAEGAGVPIVRNVPLARSLLARAEVGETVPSDLFEVIAEVVLWAREVRDVIAQVPTPGRRRAPGEDCTRYPGRAATAAAAPASSEGAA